MTRTNTKQLGRALVRCVVCVTPKDSAPRPGTQKHTLRAHTSIMQLCTVHAERVAMVLSVHACKGRARYRPCTTLLSSLAVAVEAASHPRLPQSFCSRLPSSILGSSLSGRPREAAWDCVCQSLDPRMEADRAQLSWGPDVVVRGAGVCRGHEERATWSHADRNDVSLGSTHLGDPLGHAGPAFLWALLGLPSTSCASRCHWPGKHKMCP